jgi:hypothetical protein
MKKLVLGLTAAAMMAAPATASAQVYTPPVCNPYVPTCEISETAGAAADFMVGFACHVAWPTLYHLGASCPR